MPDVVIRTLAFTDPDEYHAAWRDCQAEGIVTQRGKFRAELTTVWLDRLRLMRGKDSLPRVTQLAVDPKFFGILFRTSPSRSVSINGLESSHGDIIVFGAGSTEHHRTATVGEWGSIHLTHEDIGAAGQAIAGREITAPLVTHRVKPALPLLSRLLNLHEAAGDLAKKAPDILGKPEVGRAMDHALTEAMVACLVAGAPLEERRAYRHHARVMRRLEEVLRANSEAPLHMGDLCTAIGVSYRTLFDCCQEHLGMSPKRYLLLRRMHLAWRALRRGDAGRTTVTEIATDYGFWELGRFSVVYRSLFGESPSTTLSRPPDDPRPAEMTEPGSQFA